MVDQPLRKISIARNLRRDSTTPERLLWSVLHAGRLHGIKFRRQHPVGPYVVDFYCHESRLVIEIDGMSHDDRADQDRQRTINLAGFGVRVVRFTNDEVLADLYAVAEAILRATKSR